MSAWAAEGSNSPTRSFKSVVLTLLCISTLALLLVSCATIRVPAKRTGVIHIGAIFSLTGGGDAFGPSQVRGADLALSELNADGGVDGMRIDLTVLNDNSSPSQGRIDMQRLIDNYKVVAVLGPTLSNVAVKADPLADRLSTPVLAISNTAPGIVGRCAYPCRWIWRDSLGEAVAEPDAIAYYLSTSHATSAVVIHDANDLLGIAEAKIAASAFLSDHVRVVANLAVPAKAMNMAPLLEHAVEQHPDVVFIGTSYGEVAAAIAKGLHEDGFRGQIIGGNIFNSVTNVRILGRYGLGALSGAAWWVGNAFPVNEEFIRSYDLRYGREPDEFAAQAFTGVLILAKAIQIAGLSGASHYSVAVERQKIQRAMKYVALISPLGPFRFTKLHDVEQIVWVLRITSVGHQSLAAFCNPNC